MAATTFTSTDGLSRIAPLPHTGLQVWTTHYTRVETTTLSTSDEVLMMKLPNHITIVDAMIRADTKSTVSGKFKVGVAGTDNNLIPTFSASDGGVTVRSTAPELPLEVSLSDSGDNVYTWVKLTVNSGATTTSQSVSFALTVFYTRNGNVPDQ